MAPGLVLLLRFPVDHARQRIHAEELPCTTMERFRRNARFDAVLGAMQINKTDIEAAQGRILVLSRYRPG